MRTRLKIAILGTRGIPNRYGGFEQITQYLSSGLVGKGHDVFVYNSHNHQYQEQEWNGVSLIHCYDPENIIGSAGQFIYDFNCLIDARKRFFDIILVMGYTSSSIWRHFFPKESIVIFNMDGLEWKRAKYSRLARKFLRYAEKLAVKYADFHIADSKGVQQYLKKTYNLNSVYIPYGADLNSIEVNGVLEQYGLLKNQYFMLIARMEIENNIEVILDGFIESASKKKFIVIGNMKTKYGRFIIKKYAAENHIVFHGAIYDQDVLYTLRTNCALYFHGHSVGGTNPSLLEAMGSKVMIAAHNNIFNKSILEENAFYFSSSTEVSLLIDLKCYQENHLFTENNFKKVQNDFNWEVIVNQYESFIYSCYKQPVDEKVLAYPGYAG